MNKKKGIAVAVVLLLILLIGGMLAYFTDTDTKDNVFTLGKDIDITLTESNKLEELPVGYGSNLYSETLEVSPVLKVR